MAASRPDPGMAPDEGSALASALRELVTAGLDLAMDITPIGRVARLAPDELRRSLDDIYRSRYHDFVRYTTSRLGNRADAEDVVNEAFFRGATREPGPDGTGGTRRVRPPGGRERGQPEGQRNQP